MHNIMKKFKKGFEEVDVVTICQDLIRISSINPPGDELNMASYCGDFLRHLGFEVNLILHSEKRASILACLRGSGQVPGVMVCGHLDTVPAGAIPWHHKPLGGDINDGKIWGRGSSDMKGGLAAFLASAQVIAESGFSLQGDLWVGLTAGEEVDFLGAIEISKHREVLPLQVLLIPEPSSNALYLAQKGALWLEIGMEGRTAHASMPDLGINTVEMMSQFIYRFKSLEFPYRSHPLLDGCSSAVTTIKGGEKINTIPDECYTTIDIRTMPGQNHQEMLGQIVNLLKSFEEISSGLKTNVKVLNDRASVVTEMDNPIVIPIHKAACDVLGYEVPIKGVRFFTDSAVLTPAWEVPMVICGPGHAELAHQPDEYIDISLLKQAVEIYTLALSGYLGKKIEVNGISYTYCFHSDFFYYIEGEITMSMKHENGLVSRESQARRLEETGHKLVLLLQQPDVAQRVHISPYENEWSVLQILGHMVEMIPFWTNHCCLLIAANEESLQFGRELDAPERVNGINRGTNLELDEIIIILKQVFRETAQTILSMSKEEREKKGTHIKYGQMTVAEVIEQLIVVHAEEHLIQVSSVLKIK